MSTSSEGEQAKGLVEGPPAEPGEVTYEERVEAVSATFRNILLVVLLIFVFALAQTFILWRVCNAGMKTATSLEHQGLPTLNTMASLQEDLALYRLDSYEFLFAKEEERDAKAKAAEAMAVRIRAELQTIQTLIPDSEGQTLASNLGLAVDDLDKEFGKVRSMVDSDFAAAMKEMDDNIPSRNERVATAASALKAYGYDFSSRQAKGAFKSFGWIKNNAILFGAANVLVAFGAVMFVLLAARRSRAQLSETLGRLDGRTQELQQANTALQTEVLGHRRAEETLRESEERFAGAFEHAPIGVALVSTEGRMLKVNRAFSNLFGYAEAELLTFTWADITFPEDIETSSAHIRQLMTGETRSFQVEKRYVHADGHLITALSNISLVRDAKHHPQYMIAQIEDISERKRAEEELENTHRRLLDVSRQAGMAEVATSVLHNVGNVLNSVNISATVVIDGLKRSQRENLGKVAAMLDENSADLGNFITNDSRGVQLPGFIRLLNNTLIEEQHGAVKELELLCKNIDHIKDIVTKQQNYAKISGVSEVVEVVDLIEDSLHMNSAALTRHEVEIIRDYEKVPPLNLDKHKVLQILVNLIRNAKYACDDGKQPIKRMTVKLTNDGDRIKISVADNGIGIPPENFTRIFSHGFTTRKGGHGFGLHSGSLTAKELGGLLTVDSDGPGTGATFTLELPVKT